MNGNNEVSFENQQIDKSMILNEYKIFKHKIQSDMITDDKINGISSKFKLIYYKCI